MNKKTKIMIFGTFDGLHLGHLNFFEQARSLVENPFLIVSIARDKNVEKIKNRKTILSEKKRMILVKKSKLVNKVVLSGVEKYIPHIVKENPEIIALGYDQKAYVKNLKNELLKEGMKVKIVRLKPYKENIYKNSILNKIKNKLAK